MVSGYLSNLCGMWICLLPAIGVGGLMFLVMRSRNASLARWNLWVGGAMIGYFAVPFLILFGLIVYQVVITVPAQQERIQIDVAVILKNLKQFRSDQGHYPVALTELEPTYLNPLPFQTSGEPYKYKLNGDGFTLGYKPPDVPFFGMVSCTFYSKTDTTRCVD